MIASIRTTAQALRKPLKAGGVPIRQGSRTFNRGNGVRNPIRDFDGTAIVLIKFQCPASRNALPLANPPVPNVDHAIQMLREEWEKFMEAYE